jgi:flagellar biosynthesis/type III secretory pathway M-ring protein FliF/YscJ
MDQIRQAMANIQQQIGKMTASQKLLLASLTVIAVMTLFLVSQYAAKPATVELMAADGQGGTVRALQNGGFEAKVVDGKLMIPAGQQHYALGYLAETGQLPGDTTLLFGNLIGSQDWKASSAQHRQQFNIAKQNELSRIISNFSSIKKASVILDIPMATGLGRSAKSPTASVTLFTVAGGPITQGVVDAAAQLVSGAVSGMNPSRVQVTDGSTGRARTTSGDEAQSSSRYLEYSTQVEKHTQQKIEGLFGHIPGVVVSVTARVDITKVSSAETLYTPNSKGTVSVLISEQTLSNNTKAAESSAQAGVRSNQTASIDTGSSTGASAEQETGDTKYQAAIGQRTKNTFDPRGMPTHLSASVIIPQEYIEQIIERARPVVEGEESTPVTSDEAKEYFDAEKGIIEGLIQPHLIGVGAEGESVPGALMVSMAPLGMTMGAGGTIQSVGFMGSLAGGSGGGMLGSSGKIIETALVGVLALISLAMMLLMVKRSSKKIELPSAQDLVGVPPHLDAVGDLVGEASEGEHVMTGIEIDDQVVQVQQLRDQVTDLINQNPESAAGLLERWAEPVN